MSNVDVARQLIDDIIRHTEYVPAVYYTDEPDYPAYTGRDPDKLWEHVTACDEAEMILYQFTHGDSVTMKSVDWAYLVFGNDWDESICDCMHDKWIDKWTAATDFGKRKYQPTVG